MHSTSGSAECFSAQAAPAAAIRKVFSETVGHWQLPPSSMRLCRLAMPPAKIHSMLGQRGFAHKKRFNASREFDLLPWLV
jgi:hypothetical protein